MNPDIVWLTLGLPLLSFLTGIAFPARYSWIAPILATLLLMASVIFSFLLFQQVWNTPANIQYPWFVSGQHAITFSFTLDNTSVIMVLTISVISFLVHLFSVGYMAGEPEVARYFALLGLFTFSMTGLVMAGNLLPVFLFWELVGAASYLLIGFWHERPKAVAAATKAFLMNRLGDVSLLTGIIVLWAQAHTLSIADLPAAIQSIAAPALTLIGVLIFIGVAAKSAQFPLFSWLPDAMEGPTPVSALIHSATMVAAGIFLIGRVHFLFTPPVLSAMGVIGAVTALLGALMALVHFDLKKILAYSTMSQLGWMVMVMGVGDPASSQIHLLTHAIFKGGLFLSVGAALHVLQQATQQSKPDTDIQDIRNLGGLQPNMPLVFYLFGISAASLAGVPLSSGFLSKEGMLASLQNPSYLIVGFVLSFITGVYTFRLLKFTFFSEPGTITKQSIGTMPPVPWVMKVPLIVLAAGSFWWIVSLNPFQNSGWWSAGLGASVHHSVTGWSIVVVVLAFLVSFFYFRRQPKPSSSPAADLLRNNLGVDRLIAGGVINPVLALSRIANFVDRKCIDGIIHGGVYGQVVLAHLVAWFDKTVVDGIAQNTARISRFAGRVARSFVNGKIQSYILWAVTGIIIFMVWDLFK